jgi:hypothetical protein
MKRILLNTIFVLLLIAWTGSGNAALILLVDDSEGQAVQVAWAQALADLGHTTTIEGLSEYGNSLQNFDLYDAVIWTVGDRAYDNITGANWAKMTNYANSGGKLIYAGGHSVYVENLVGNTAIESFFGISSTYQNMPEFGSATTVTGTGNSSYFGTTTYTVGPWAGGQYGGMFSGFNTTTGVGLLNDPPFTGTGPYVVAESPSGNAQIWGLDLNHVVSYQRSAFLGAALDELFSQPASAVPEPTTALLWLVGGVVILRYGRSQKSKGRSQKAEGKGPKAES